MSAQLSENDRAELCKACGKPQKLIGPRCECGEPDAPSSLAVATGSLPVSSADLIRMADAHTARAFYQRSAADKMWEEDDPEGKFRAGWRRDADISDACAEIIRRHAASMNERQPEENTEISDAKRSL